MMFLRWKNVRFMIALMLEGSFTFAHSLLPFVATKLALHRNPVTCLLCGLDRPLVVCADGVRIENDFVLIRPDVEHAVEIGGRAKVLYFDGLPFPLDAAVADKVPRQLSSLAIDALDGNAGAQCEFRSRLIGIEPECPPIIAEIVEDMIKDPMGRMSQFELAERTGLERTRALRSFKAATGMTFRSFKNWTALQAAARQIAQGELIRTAAMDAGFSDSAHLTKTFRSSFGITPSAATADRLH